MSTFLFRVSIFIGFVIILVTLIFGYLFFEPSITETEEVITVINIEQWGNEAGKYFVFTNDEVFLNANDYYQNKHNADELMKQFRKGYTYKVKVVGVYIPFLPRFRNILNIIDYSANEYYPEK